MIILRNKLFSSRKQVKGPKFIPGFHIDGIDDKGNKTCTPAYIDENGDVKEEFEEMSPEEKLKPLVACSMADLGDGIRVPDVSYLDKFQAMDLLENYVDNMDISSIASPVVEPSKSPEDE